MKDSRHVIVVCLIGWLSGFGKSRIYVRSFCFVITTSNYEWLWDSRFSIRTYAQRTAEASSSNLSELIHKGRGCCIFVFHPYRPIIPQTYPNYSWSGGERRTQPIPSPFPQSPLQPKLFKFFFFFFGEKGNSTSTKTQVANISIFFFLHLEIETNINNLI